MKWIESHLDLADHPKLRRLSRALEVGTPAAVGHLHLLWWWSVRYAQDGDLSEFDRIEISEAARWPGEPDRFIEAMLEAGFLDLEGEDLLIHDWHDHAGRAIESREQAVHDGSVGNHIRWHLKRGVSSPECPHCQTRGSGGESGADRGANRTAQHRTEHDSTAAAGRNQNIPPRSGGDDDFLRLCREVAEETADQRESDGYPIRSRPAFIAKLTVSEEVRNEARKRLGAPAQLGDLLGQIGQPFEPDQIRRKA